jgi:hypothetical protein
VIRSLKVEEVTALHDLADNGGLLCDCDSSPDLCHCSTIMMLCGEWNRMRATIVDTIESLERNSTSAPVVECLKAAIGVEGTPSTKTKEPQGSSVGWPGAHLGVDGKFY